VNHCDDAGELDVGIVDDCAVFADEVRPPGTALLAHRAPLRARPGLRPTRCAAVHDIQGDAEFQSLVLERIERWRVAMDPWRWQALAEEDAARVDGERLVATYVPSPLGDVVRGDGCVSCPSFGDDCQGVEMEWWNELEWEDVLDRIG
jgi:hypothetical protein